MNNINFNSEQYVAFCDYKNIMVDVVGITCSICNGENLDFVLKNHPIFLGDFLKEQLQKRHLSDLEIDMLIIKPLKDWQNFEDKNTAQMVPTFLCENCFYELKNR